MAKTREKDWGRFEDVDRSDNHSMIWVSEGKGGSGKTHFLCTGPEPIAIHMFDPGGMKGLSKNKLFRKKDIKVLNYDIDLSKYDESDRQKASEEILEQFKENQTIALQNARTVGWDKEDKIWELIRYARLGSVSDRPNLYYELNLEYYGLYHDAQMAGVNMGVIRGMKEKWGKTGSNREGKAQYGGLGEMEGRGHKEAPEAAEIALAHRWDSEVREFVTTITEKCRIGDDPKKLMGTEHVGLTVKELGEMVYPETAEMDPSPWE